MGQKLIKRTHQGHIVAGNAVFITEGDSLSKDTILQDEKFQLQMKFENYGNVMLVGFVQGQSENEFHCFIENTFIDVVLTVQTDKSITFKAAEVTCLEDAFKIYSIVNGYIMTSTDDVTVLKEIATEFFVTAAQSQETFRIFLGDSQEREYGVYEVRIIKELAPNEFYCEIIGFEEASLILHITPQHVVLFTATKNK